MSCGLPACPDLPTLFHGSESDQFDDWCAMVRGRRKALRNLKNPQYVGGGGCHRLERMFFSSCRYGGPKANRRTVQIGSTGATGYTARRAEKGDATQGRRAQGARVAQVLWGLVRPEIRAQMDYRSHRRNRRKEPK